ncbi:double-cubane-cluster-containing anaerobic reductase [Pseudodesulfovibrio sp.]|uniref:double-cubane-cluster-containing anaerobic reductase n=1 Tax=unclassified Pseudodesulfovibrio TaxID=2661612 RepID=UPI003B0078A2
MDTRYFVNFSELSLADLETWKDQGRKVAGVYCLYAPGEIMRAAGMAAVSLCGKKQTPIKEAEKELPPSLCPLIKSSYGYGVTDTCPFFAASDVLVAETTCDGKKKMYELMGRLKPLHVMHLPHTQQGGAALQYWLQALHGLADFLVAQSGSAVTEEALHEQIVLQNAICRELGTLSVLITDDRSPLTWREMLSVQESKSFAVYPDQYLKHLTALRTDLQAYLAQPDIVAKSGPRILLTGCPVGKGSEKVIRIAEELGARVVCMENCSGLKGISLTTDETGDPWTALARRYLQIPCSCMTPNPNRLDSLREMAEVYKADALVDLTWLGCHTYNAESTIIREYVEDQLDLPFLHVETDYSESDTEQLRTRLEAFLEIV